MKEKLLIIVFFISIRGDSQSVGCDTLSFGPMAKKEFIKLKAEKYFLYSAYILLDTCYFENRAIKKIDRTGISYFTAFIPTKGNVLFIENYLTTQAIDDSMKQKSIGKLMRGFYRQYIAYYDSTDRIAIQILFCSKSFFKKNEFFRYNFLSPMITNYTNDEIYSCKLLATKDFNKISLVSFRKISR